MKIARLFVLTVLQCAASVTAVTVTNGSVTSYDPAELLSRIFSSNITVESRQRGYGLVKFEDQHAPGIDPYNEDPGQYGLIDPGQRPLKFEDEDQDDNLNYNPQSEGSIKFQDSEDDLSSNNGAVTFQDNNKVESQENKRKRKRRRRRKPKNGVFNHAEASGLSPGVPGAGGRPNLQGPFQAGYGQNLYENSGYPIQPFRRPRRPKPTLASQALSSITEALTSIAQYDDYQCVPRLLCEAAGGGALTNNGVLQSITGIQPLLTLLSAYNGISTSPLFVFGRAVFLGMTSKGNTGTCRYAYSQCPTDPEQLIYYLNNHNGGFFRFFNAPQLPDQNLDQFYNQLGNQGFGIYQPQPNPSQQSYGYPNDLNSGQNVGLYSQNNQYQNPGAFNNQQYGQNPDYSRPGAYDKPGLYSNPSYSPNYASDYNNYGAGNQIRFKDSYARIEKRIQNQAVQNLADDSFDDDDVRTKWQFPDDTNLNSNHENIRDSRTLKFPGEEEYNNNQKDSTRKGKQVYFPDNDTHKNYYNIRQQIYNNNNRYQTTTSSYNNGQNNQHYYTNQLNNYNNNNKYKPAIKYPDYNTNSNQNRYQNQQNYYNNKQNLYNNNNKYQPTTVYNNEEYVFDHKHNFYVKKEVNYNNNAYNTNSYKRNEDDGLKTVYVVRGNGDPNKPEIVKLRPGQSIY